MEQAGSKFASSSGRTQLSYLLVFSQRSWIFGKCNTWHTPGLGFEIPAPGPEVRAETGVFRCQGV